MTVRVHILNNIRKSILCISQRYFSKKTSSDVRVRFAPSPTGYLHLGGLRTALYNYLFTKSLGGQFIVRIEDTDRTRIVDGAVDQLLNDLEWCGLVSDESPRQGGLFGPYVQSERLNIYREHLDILLKNGSAYHCFCTDRRLDLLRKEAVRTRQIPKYDNRCRHLTRDQVNQKLENGEKSCIRFKLTSDCETFEDLVYGNIAYDVALNEGDPVIVKTDGYPTYHFANVVDDHLMEISHVLRGVEWQISTTKHILIAFNWEPPLFAHLPLLLNADGSKLSKRQGDIKISSYRNNGIFPQALINFVTYSGGGFNRESGLKSCSMNELIDMFELERINAHSARVMPERLKDFNRLELMEQIKDPVKLEGLIAHVKNIVIKSFPKEYEQGSLDLNEDHIRAILMWSKTRISDLYDLVSPDMAFLWIMPSLQNRHTDEKFVELVKAFKIIVQNTNVEKEPIKTLLKSFAKDNDIAFNELMKFLRFLLSGLKHGPSVAEMIEILGKSGTLKRIENYISNLKR